MSRRIFISYNYAQDGANARNIHVFFQEFEGKCNGQPAYVEGNFSEEGDKAIDQAIRAEMDQCKAVIFVVGDISHNSKWINREAQLAKSKALPRLAVRSPGSTGGPPNELKENNIDLVKWDHDELCDALNRLF